MANDKILEEIKETKTNKNYEYLVFSGGGLKGISYCGVVASLEKLGILHDVDGKSKIKGFAGTSIGSLFATALALGYKSSDLNDIMKSVDLTKFFDGKIEMMKDMALIFEYFGLCTGNYIEEFIGNLVLEKTGNRDCTIKELWDQFGINLVIVGTLVNYEKSVYFCHNNENPDLANIPIRKAVRISMSLPLIYHPMQWKGDTYVDGGILDNFPIHVFDGQVPGEVKAKMNLLQPNAKVLGIRILPEAETKGQVRMPVDGFFNYCCSYINMFLLENERRIMTPANVLRTVHVITPDYPLTNFNLTILQKLDLVLRGSDYTEQYFK